MSIIYIALMVSTAITTVVVNIVTNSRKDKHEK